LEVKCKLAIPEKGDFSVTEKAFAAVKSIQMIDQQKSPLNPKGFVARNPKT
jgi:hypothetical protein